MELKKLFPWTAGGLVVSGAAVALVACGGGSSGELPTTAAFSSGAEATVSASDLTTSDESDGVSTPPEGRPEGPPEEALAACAALPAEATCSFTSPRDGHTVDGTCQARRDDPNQYVCFPDDWDGRGGPGHGRQGPPEEALTACEGIATGTTCSFEASFGTVEGTCSEGHGDSGSVACRPEWADGEGPFGPGQGGRGHDGPPEEALAACQGQPTEATCSFEGAQGQVDGTCRTGRDGTSLVCAPANWPPR